MAKKDQYQKSSLKDQEEAKEIVPKTDLEIGTEFTSYNSPEAGMNKRKQQQKKQ